MRSKVSRGRGDLVYVKVTRDLQDKTKYKTTYKTRLKSGKQKRERTSKVSRWATPSISKKFRYPTRH